MSTSKKEKKGFSIELHHKHAVADYTVYFETKGKVVHCYIQDFFVEKEFKGKSVCNNLDTFNQKEGMEIAFNKAISKRDSFYDKMIREHVQHLLDTKCGKFKITYKFQKLLRK